MLTLLIILLVPGLVFGGFGSSRGWGYAGWSPLGIILVVILLFVLLGHV